MQTVSDYIDLVRKRIDDRIEPFRFNDETIMQALEEGYRTLKRVRPSAGYTNGRLPREGEDTNFLDKYEEVRASLKRYGFGIVDWASGLVLENDNSDTANREVATSLQQKAMAIFAT